MITRLLSADEMAEILGLKRAHIYDLVRRGILPVVRINRRVRFDPNEIQLWISRGGTLQNKGDTNEHKIKCVRNLQHFERKGEDTQQSTGRRLRA